MKNITCPVDGCEQAARSQGRCARHYMAGIRDGSILRIAPKSARERFWAKVDKSGSCWVWTGSKNPDGYGKFNFQGSPRYAHRVSYKFAFGDISQGAEIDHKCLNRSCVKPAHLRIATPKQNNENLAGAQSNSKSGVRGVSWHSKRSMWVVQVGHNRRNICIGYFEHLKDAEAAAVEARNELFTHNALDRIA